MNPGIPYSQRELEHLAELAQLVFEVRPLYAVGYIITLQREFGLPATYLVPSFSTLGLRDSYQAQRDEMARGIKDARARVVPGSVV